MPKIRVEIEWDTPDEENWLNPYNLELALSSYCTNTRFNVNEVEDNKLKRILELHRSLLYRCENGEINVSAKKIEEETEELKRLCGEI